jgi:short-subunit dehydrogenase
MVNLENKVIWITGASSGIGEALAKALVSEDAILILSARRENELERVKKDCGEGHADRIFLLPFDVTDQENLESITQKAWNIMGRIDILINNAGISQRSLAVDSVPEVDRQLFAVNYFGPVSITKYILPHFMEQGNGHIVVIGSIAGLIYSPKRSSYSATKYAVEGFFNTLRAELYKTDIKVTIVNPGYIQTNISYNALDGSGNKFNQQSPGQAKGIPADVCADKIVKAIKLQKRSVKIAGLKERLGVFMHRFFPGIYAKLIPRISAV